MTSGRPYSPARPAERVLEVLLAERGAQFDPDAVDAFVATLATAGDYHDVVDTVSELDLVSRRAQASARGRTRVGGAAR
jgi:HD-GYP domain-containing protein (c-di-GMP phosphodiesterase class II)